MTIQAGVNLPTFPCPNFVNQQRPTQYQPLIQNIPITSQDHLAFTGKTLIESTSPKKTLKEALRSKFTRPSAWGSPYYITAAYGGNKSNFPIHWKTEQNKDINKFDKNGFTPMTAAASGGHPKFIQMLIQTYNAQVNSADGNGYTPMTMAAVNGKKDVIRLLYEQGADIDEPDGNGLTPLQLAQANHNSKTVKLLQELRSQKLKTQQAQPQKPTAAQEKVFLANQMTEAAGNGDILAMLKLNHQNKNADFITPNRFGETPLTVAAAKGQAKVIRSLVKDHGLDANVQDKLGHSPLRQAIVNEHLDVIKMLIEECNVDLHENKAMYMALTHGKKAVVNMLSNMSCLDLSDEIEDKSKPVAAPLKAEDYTDIDENEILRNECSRESLKVKQEVDIKHEPAQSENSNPNQAIPDVIDSKPRKPAPPKPKKPDSLNPRKPAPAKPRKPDTLKSGKPTPPAVDWESTGLNLYADWNKPTPPASVISNGSTLSPESSLSQASFAYRPHAPSINQALLGVASTASVFSNDSSIRPESSVSQVSFLHRLHPPSIQQVLKSDTSSAQDASSIASSQDSQDSQSTIIPAIPSINIPALNTVQDILKILEENRNHLTDEEVERLAPFLDKKVAKEVGTLLRQNQTTQQSKVEHEKRLLLLQHSAFDNNPQLNPDKRLQKFWMQVSDYFSR